jgi:hypothetical protein
VVPLFAQLKLDTIHRLSGEADHSRVLLHGALSPNPPNWSIRPRIDASSNQFAGID